MKTCFKCGVEKPLEDFYKHSEMADVHLGKCKECTKVDTKANLKVNKEYYKEYDRFRNSHPNRKMYKAMYLREWRKRNPEKYKAQSLVGNAVRDGKLIVLPCEVCFNTHDIHAHHDDYSKPLDVRWLCAKCHKDFHNGISEK